MLVHMSRCSNFEIPRRQVAIVGETKNRKIVGGFFMNSVNEIVEDARRWVRGKGIGVGFRLR